MKYLTRDGEEILLAEWLGLQATHDYAHVKQDMVNGICVSTIWTGIQLLDDAPPLIFETMTFVSHDTDSEWHERSWRYRTEAEALANHEAICSEIRTGYQLIVQEE